MACTWCWSAAGHTHCVVWALRQHRAQPSALPDPSLPHILNRGAEHFSRGTGSSFVPLPSPRCAGWGNIVAFTKVLTISHSWIPPSITLLYPLFRPFLEYFQQVSFFHFHPWAEYLRAIHPRAPFPHLLPFHWFQTFQTGPVLPSCSLILYMKKKTFLFV
jgi:hypothetical protein